MQQGENHLSRSMSTLGLVATGVSSMIGASIYIVPFMIQKNVPGIGPYVLPAFLFAAIPALLAAFAYAILSSAMPRAGGSYIYVSRSINAYWGFVASFSQWFGLSIVIGVVAYMVIPFFSDIAGVIHNQWLSDFLASRSVRLIFSLLLLWLCVLVNIVGIKTYQLTIIVLVGVTFVFSSIVLIIGLIYNQQDFLLALFNKEGKDVLSVKSNFNFTSFFSASAILFASFIGFDSIAQAGGEAKNPSKSLPRAIIITFCSVAIFYLAFTYSVYNIVPWNYMYDLALVKDISAPGLLSILLSPFWSFLIILGACIALLKDLPSMILSVSRLVFAWSRDRLFQRDW